MYLACVYRILTGQAALFLGPARIDLKMNSGFLNDGVIVRGISRFMHEASP